MNYFNRIFIRKEKNNLIFESFLISHKSVVKTFLKWITNNWSKGTH